MLFITLGKVCFVCEDETKEVELLGKKLCAGCGGELPEQPQWRLEHMSAHVLFNPKIDTGLEPCGLCLWPAQCKFYLKKGRGVQNGQQINYRKSDCPNMVWLTYSIAEKSMTASPCSNMPIKCPWCEDAAPAVWRYNMKDHIQGKHPYIHLPDYESLWKITSTEQKVMKTKWDDHKKVKQTRKSKSKAAAPLVVSAAHSSRLTLTKPYVLLQSNEVGTFW